MDVTNQAPTVEPLDERVDHVRGETRHFPLTQIHPHALAAAAAAEAAARQARFWEMHELLFHRQKALEDDDLRTYANEVGLDLDRFDRDRADEVDGVLHHGGYDTEALREALIGPSTSDYGSLRANDHWRQARNGHRCIPPFGWL